MMRDTGLRNQAERPSWMKLIEGDNHRLTKVVSGLVDQRRDGHLILPWTRCRHLLRAFELSVDKMTDINDSTSMAEFLRATKTYYSTVEGFLTSDHCYRTSDAWKVTLRENVTCTASLDKNQRHVERLATGRSYVGKWMSSFMPLTIQTTTPCTSKQ